MKINFKILSVLSMLLITISASAQDDLMNMLDEQTEQPLTEVAYTFKSTHIINSQDIERMKTGQLDFRINHRFGQINEGAYEFWGLDNALVSLDFGYGINDKIMVGLRRSSFNKTYDGSLKFTLLRQMEGSKVIPVAVSYYTNMSVNTLKDKLMDSVFTDRLGYVHQLLIAHKFNEKFSLQLMPTFVHRNLVNYNEDNNIYSLGIGGRYKLIRRLAITFEYFWASNTIAASGNSAKEIIFGGNNGFYNPLSVGIDIETGGHVFQLFLTNSRVMEEGGFLSNTTGSWLDGGIYFGFNISRVFALTHPKE
jgi:hypothetical protein